MVYRLLKNGQNLMFQRQSSILSAAGVLMIMSLGSAVLGLYKLHAFSHLLGVSNRDSLDAFKAAFKLPDLIFQILVAGALNAAFIPVFGELLQRKDKNQAWDLAISMMNGALVVFGLVAILVLVFADPFVKLFIAPGFTGEKLALTANLTRLMMLSPVLLGMSAFLTGGIQVHHRFIVPALAPILYNIGSILGIEVFYHFWGVWGLAYGVLLGSVLHLAVQLPLAYHLGFNYRLLLQWRDKAMRQVGKLMMPRTVGLSIDQLESLVGSMLLSTFPAGIYTLYSQVFSLVTFPISFFGVSIAQASLPTLSREAIEDKEAFRQTLFSTFHQILYLIIPVAVLMVVLRVPITRVVLNFPYWQDTLIAAQVLLFFAPGLVAQSALHLWVRGFYALQDTISPLVAGAVGVITSVSVMLLTIGALDMRGIALGITLGGFMTLAILMLRMQTHLGRFGWADFYVPTLRILACGAIMAVAVYAPIKTIESMFLPTSTTINLLMLSILVSGFGFSLYLFISWVMGSEEITMFLTMAKKLRSWREAFMKVPVIEESSVVSEVSAES